MAPLYLELKRRPEIECIACVTAQHRKMLDDVLNCFGIKPDFDLDVMKVGQTLSYITSSVLNGFGEVLREARPDLVLVHGNTPLSKPPSVIRLPAVAACTAIANGKA